MTTEPTPLTAENPRARKHREVTADGWASWTCIPLTEALDAARSRETALREAAQGLVYSAVLIPVETEDDDSPSEVWSVHSQPLALLRAALAKPEKWREASRQMLADGTVREDE